MLLWDECTSLQLAGRQFCWSLPNQYPRPLLRLSSSSSISGHRSYWAVRSLWLWWARKVRAGALVVVEGLKHMKISSAKTISLALISSVVFLYSLCPCVCACDNPSEIWSHSLKHYGLWCRVYINTIVKCILRYTSVKINPCVSTVATG